MALFDLSLLRQQFIDMIYHINITINIFTLFSTVNINIIYKFNNCNININKFTLQLLYCFERDSFFEQIFIMVEKFGVKSAK